MARKVAPLTNTQVKNAKPKDKEYNLADGDGLMLRIKTNGSKLWLFNYSRPFTKKRANLSFGSYPELSLAEAREKRREARSLLANDIDPQTAKIKEQVQKAHTLKDCAQSWFTIKQTSISPDYANDVWRSLELHIFPRLGKLPIHTVDAPITIDTLKPLAAKGSLEQVRRIIQRLNEIMTYAVNTGVIHHNPLIGIKEGFHSPKKEKMPSIRPEELPQLMKALYNASIKPTTRNLILWQLHTMVRPSEAAGTRWDEIDLDKKLWIIPAERMKKKKEHAVPLTDQALRILEDMRVISEKREHVFPGNKNPRQPSNSETANMALKRMGYKDILVAHGLRSIASTALNEQSFNSDVIEACLAHEQKNQVRAAYNRANYLEQRLPVMKWWSEFIQDSLIQALN